MQLGFVIDHARCIGCHACTVACKAENDVPLGDFRTWVKYTEVGEFPEVRRSFAVLRCNQCTDAPCVSICPVRALEKRPDGIVDIDPARCIGCKSCMQACPYDALYINDTHGVAEKCHFCAHRVERGMAPACVVVCPTEAIIPGDFDDPQSLVSRMRTEGGLSVRKPQAGTGPNVYYHDVAPAGIEPQSTHGAGGFLWADQVPGLQLDSQIFEAAEEKAQARTVYDVNHAPLWGGRVSAYLFTKSLSAGAFLAALPLMAPFARGDGLGRTGTVWTLGLALLFLGITTLLLVSDLKRPERFWYILRYPQWGSWLTRGTIFLMAYGLLITFGLWGAIGPPLLPRAAAGAVNLLTAVAAALTACYTAWLFAQAHGRPLWMRRGLAAVLVVHAWVGGAALLLPVLGAIAVGGELHGFTRGMLLAGLAAHAVFLFLAGTGAPARRREEYERAHALLTKGPLARRHWGLAVGLGIALPAVLLLLPVPWIWNVAAVAALVGLFVDQDNLVRAGQALPIS